MVEKRWSEFTYSDQNERVSSRFPIGEVREEIRTLGRFRRVVCGDNKALALSREKIAKES